MTAPSWVRDMAQWCHANNVPLPEIVWDYDDYRYAYMAVRRDLMGDSSFISMDAGITTPGPIEQVKIYGVTLRQGPRGPVSQQALLDELDDLREERRSIDLLPCQS